MKIIYTGLESSGKSLALSKQAIQLTQRNKKWYQKYGFIRPIYSNLKFSKTFEDENKGYIKYWSDMSEIVGKTGCDILWDEVSTDLSAEKRAPLPKSLNKWLRQGSKRGVDIYGTAQEFHDIHVQFRRRVERCYNMRKFMACGRPGDNKPPVKRIWGLILSWKIQVHPYNELEPQKSSIIPGFLYITRALTGIFDTNESIPGSEYPPLEHVKRTCPVCNKVQITHY